MTDIPDSDVLIKPYQECLMPGDSPEAKAWNDHFSLLVAEYETAIVEGDPGWAESTKAEIEKVTGCFGTAMSEAGSEHETLRCVGGEGLGR